MASTAVLNAPSHQTTDAFVPNTGADLEAAVRQAREDLDRHTQEMIEWHFSPETGCPFWLDWAQDQRTRHGFDPLKEVHSWADMMKFPHFQDEWLRDEQNERWVPQHYQGRPFFVFETGGTTGMPKQRVSWDDHLIDYSEFSDTLNDDAFPPGGHWLMLGPTGSRRLRLAIEHLANHRGGSCFHIDLDARWVKALINDGKLDEMERYKAHVIEQGVQLLKHRKFSCLFTTPKLLEALGERISLVKYGIKGTFVGGTQITPQTSRFLIEEVLENQIAFVPTYGNALMGLACSRPLTPEDNYSITYHAPQPRAVMRVVNPANPDENVPFGEFGRVELTTMTREFFMPRFLERDEAIRRQPVPAFPWDGVGDVRPFQSMTKKVIEGVY